MKKLQITPDLPAERIDVFLAEKFPEYSRSYFQRLIKLGKITVNSKLVTPHAPVKIDDKIEVEFVSEKKDILAQKLPIEIIHEDKDLLIINKKPGMVVHPACGNWDGTLLNALYGYAKDKFKPMLVHRLDKNTSGLMIVAKTEKAKTSLVKQFQKRSVKKTYMAAVCGVINETNGRIEAPLGRSPEDRKKIVVGPLSSKPAITEFTVIKRAPEYTLVEAHPVTGRTHQIRSHFAYIGHPVLGDDFYGAKCTAGGFTANRHMLHAAKIVFNHPGTGKMQEFSCPLPKDMKKMWDKK